MKNFDLYTPPDMPVMSEDEAVKIARELTTAIDQTTADTDSAFAALKAAFIDSGLTIHHIVKLLRLAETVRSKQAEDELWQEFFQDARNELLYDNYLFESDCIAMEAKFRSKYIDHESTYNALRDIARWLRLSAYFRRTQGQEDHE